MRYPDRYYVQKIYTITCETCNEDITRPLGCDEPRTRAEVELAIHAHERDWHKGAKS